jgi:hypothetical protein
MSKESCCPPPEPSKSCGPPQQGESADCCPPSDATEACCPGVVDDRPGYKLWPFVCGWLIESGQQIPQVATRLTATDIAGRWQMRWGLGRTRYTIAPGLYAIGAPSSDSPVLVTANYKMTFDILRRDMHGHDAWILVIDTKGINVWCAAGKGTFGTDEIVRQVKRAKLQEVVKHRTLILPQLGAPGVAAHEVAKACGFKVLYGPVRSSDLPQFINTGNKASPQMRRVTFGLIDRLVLTPVELVNMWKHILYSIAALFLLGGIGPDIFSLSAAWSRGGAGVATGLLALLTGAVLTPLLLPWIPGRAFAMKGAITGLAVGIISALILSDSLTWLNMLTLVITTTTVSSWCAMHFTGSSTFTSPSGVEKEMRQAIPAQASALLVGAICWLAAAF